MSSQLDPVVENTTGIQLTPEQISSMQERIDTNLSGLNIDPVEGAVEIKANIDKLLLRYKIGRFNPPHKGHIALFIQNIIDMEQAKQLDPTLTTKVIIFAGNGAKNEPRSKNPLDFGTKKTVIQYLIRQELLKSEYRQYTLNLDDMDSIVTILPKDYTDSNGTAMNPQNQLHRVANEVVSEFPTVNAAATQLAVGDKDGDATKLSYMNASLNKLFVNPKIKFESIITPMAAITDGRVELSASRIRQIVSETTNPGDFRDRVLTETGLDYGTMAETIWNAIKTVQVAESRVDASRSAVNKSTAERAGPRIVTKATTKKVTTKKGGSTRRYNRKTKSTKKVRRNKGLKSNKRIRRRKLVINLL
jgi:hypothetical protein